MELGRQITTLKVSNPNNTVNSIAFSPDGKTLASGNFEEIKLWNVETSQEIKSFLGQTDGVNSSMFSPDGKILASGSSESVKLWNLESGQLYKSLDGHINVSSITFSHDGKTLASGSWDTTIRLWNGETGQLIKSLTGHTSPIYSIAFSPDGKTLASSDSMNYTIKIWNVETGKQIQTLVANAIVYSMAFSPDGKTLASNGDDNSIKLWSMETVKQIKSFDGHRLVVKSVAFSADGKTLATGSDDETVKLWNVQTGQQIKSLEGHTGWVNSVVFSPDGKILASGSDDSTIRLWNTEMGQLIKSLDGGALAVNSVAFSPDGKTLVSGTDGTLKIWNVEQRKNLVTISLLNREDWIITTPDGRFDTNKLENTQGLHWIMPDAPFTPLSFEVFMRDYYEPNLLPRLLKCTEENNCEQEFKPVRNLTELNRTQPKVKITDVKPTGSPEVVEVTVEAEDAVSEFQKDKQNKPLRSGVEDVRLFRDGQLVGYAPERDGAAALDKNGKFTKTFTVRLPKNTEATEFSFTAYAFNSDRVKSETAQKTFVLPKPLPSAKGNAFIITVGVNANEDRRYDLRYAANDARRLQEELAKRLPKDKYRQIVQIPLVSDYDKDGKLAENNATKAKIKAVLDKLAGKTVSDDVLKDVPNKDLLTKVQPEDLVLIAFSGHGYADREGVFYLVPSDIGKSTSGGLAGVLEKSISSDELSLWLRDVDAGEMLMIVDACHSAAAVQGAGFKPGPMGARGLGQLSYDKGMRILTATQADSLAWEPDCLENGLLTYSLVANGLVRGLADIEPKDNRLTSREWFGFAVKDVPLLYEKLEKREKGLCLSENKSVVHILDRQKSNLNLQQPSLFDFSRRDRQYELVNSVLR